MEEGDTAIILNGDIILDLGIIGIYVYQENGLPGVKDQVYCRQIRFLKKGPIKIPDLPKDFQQKGEYPLALEHTMRKYSVAQEIFDNLIKILSKG